MVAEKNITCIARSSLNLTVITVSPIKRCMKTTAFTIFTPQKAKNKAASLVASFPTINNVKNVSQTLYFTLCARAMDKDFSDPIAEKIINENKQLLKYKPGFLTKKIITSRARFFDEQVKRIHQKLPVHQLALVNLGGGLCSRFSRVGECLSNSIHLDLPEVISLLKSTFPETSNHLLSEDLNDDSWPGAVAECLTNEETPVFTMEGVSMYLEKAALLNLFSKLPEYFPSGFIVCDLLHPFFADKSYLVRNVAQVNASFASGVARTNEILESSSKLRLDYVRPPVGIGGLPQVPPFNLYQFATFSY